MESLVIDTGIETSTDVTAETAAIAELSANDLALIGGGTANVCWL